MTFRRMHRRSLHDLIDGLEETAASFTELAGLARTAFTNPLRVNAAAAGAVGVSIEALLDRAGALIDQAAWLLRDVTPGGFVPSDAGQIHRQNEEEVDTHA